MISAWPVIIFFALWVLVLKASNAKLERRLELNAAPVQLSLPPAPEMGDHPYVDFHVVRDDPRRPGHYTTRARTRGGKEY